MKRHPALQDLSRDHHVVLAYCQRIRRSLARDAPGPEIEGLFKEFLAFYASDMAPHFEEEDRVVLPAAEATGDVTLRAIAGEVRNEHVEFRGALAALSSLEGSQARAAFRALEPRIAAHVHREEEELFQRVQAAVGEADLQSLWRRSFEFRKRHRSPGACGVRPPRIP